MKKGTIVLVPFPFTDLKGSKNRPAVVLISSDLDVTVCFITSDLKWHSKQDIILTPTSHNGLKTKSVIRVGKIATIDIDLIIGELGYLTNTQIKDLNNSLINLLELK